VCQVLRKPRKTIVHEEFVLDKDHQRSLKTTESTTGRNVLAKSPGGACSPSTNTRWQWSVGFVTIPENLKTTKKTPPKKTPKQMTSSRCSANGSLVAEMEFLQCSSLSDRKKLQRATPVLLPAIVVSHTQKKTQRKTCCWGYRGQRSQILSSLGPQMDGAMDTTNEQRARD
jgi:hypothetical protein